MLVINQFYLQEGMEKVGQDISYAIEFFGLPTQKGIEIRGELLMKKETFENN